MASKFLLLQESVRDAADLYLSLKYPPLLLVNDTPCWFARHLDLREPVIAAQFWGDRLGCFETPIPGTKPKEVRYCYITNLLSLLIEFYKGTDLWDNFFQCWATCMFNINLIINVALDILILHYHYPVLLLSGPSVDTCMQDNSLLLWDHMLNRVMLWFLFFTAPYKPV